MGRSGRNAAPAASRRAPDRCRRALLVDPAAQGPGVRRTRVGGDGVLGPLASRLVVALRETHLAGTHCRGGVHRRAEARLLGVGERLGALATVATAPRLRWRCACGSSGVASAASRSRVSASPSRPDSRAETPRSQVCLAFATTRPAWALDASPRNRSRPAPLARPRSPTDDAKPPSAAAQRVARALGWARAGSVSGSRAARRVTRLARFGRGSAEGIDRQRQGQRRRVGRVVAGVWLPTRYDRQGDGARFPLSPQLSVAARYDRSGVSFAYPENWGLEEEHDEDARVNLTLSSPNTAFWTLMVYAETLDLAARGGPGAGGVARRVPRPRS